MTATGLIIDGKKVPVPGLEVANYEDDPRLKLEVPEDGRRRTERVQLVVLHTTKGIPGGKDRRPQLLLAGAGPDSNAEARVAKFWSTTDKQSGAHIVIDFDRSVGCLADLAQVCAFHAKAMNQRGVGIEIYQGSKAELYMGQLEATADVVDVITAAFGIQRQIPDRYRGAPVTRLATGGRDCWGVVGHRDGDDNRGLGDPGDAIFDVLAARGYERVNYATAEDRRIWRDRQSWLNQHHRAKLVVDGIPGPATVGVLKAVGYQHGLWACPPSS
jgi:hypothetical protein